MATEIFDISGLDLKETEDSLGGSVPGLTCENISDAVAYVLSTPANVNVSISSWVYNIKSKVQNRNYHFGYH